MKATKIFDGTLVVAGILIGSCVISKHEAFASNSKNNNSPIAAKDSGAVSDVQNALNLYNQRQYAAAADAFERVIKTSRPNARLYYYAALANSASLRQTRAKQLFEYIAVHYAGTQEASYAQNALSYFQRESASRSQVDSQETELPSIIKNALPKEMQAMLDTPMGKEAVRQAMKEQTANVQAIRKAEAQGLLHNTKAMAAVRTPRQDSRRSGGEFPFTAQDIAREGANGIDQSGYPNCWFEASMSALAQLPRGQRLLANMIRLRQDGKYIVRFPNDGAEYIISEDDIANNGIYNRALWASIIECAELKKFPDNAGASGVDDDQSRLEVGLGCITGHKAQVINPSNCDIQELSSFIGAVVKSQNPIVAATYGDIQLASLPKIVVPSHAYTIIDFDPAKKMVTIRNPHGQGSDRYRLAHDPNHFEFEQLNDGVAKLSLTKFQQYFHSVARSFI